ncbi:hypothetical protein HOD29_06370 [archaeon]|jgi:hypothetical protein|nr:hypothetical protein [archaeon]
MTEKEKTNQLEKITNLGGLLNYMHEIHRSNYNQLIDKYNDICISVEVRSKYLSKNKRKFEAVEVMKKYLKDISQQIHVVVNEHYKK